MTIEFAMGVVGVVVCAVSSILLILALCMKWSR